MRIGLYLHGATRSLDDVVRQAQQAETAGLDTVWASTTNDYDPLTLLGIVGRETRRIELGTWVVPVLSRHPGAVAQAAHTAQAACRGRLTLALGVSHAAVVRKQLGIDFVRPLEYMEEFLKVLDPLLAGASVAFDGARLRARLRLDPAPEPRPVVLVAALQPRMLALAGAASDGAAIWLGSPRYLAEQALPIVREAAARAGRPEPRVVAGLPVVVTEDRAKGRAAVAQVVGPSARLPSYRAVLDAGGAAQPEDVALVGPREAFGEQLEALQELGISDLHAVVVPVPGDPGAFARTLEALAAWRS